MDASTCATTMIRFVTHYDLSGLSGHTVIGNPMSKKMTMDSCALAKEVFHFRPSVAAFQVLADFKLAVGRKILHVRCRSGMAVRQDLMIYIVCDDNSAQKCTTQIWRRLPPKVELANPINVEQVAFQEPLCHASK
jgi:hypothetical protein